MVFIRERHLSVRGPRAPSTTLRVVPLPRYAEEDLTRPIDRLRTICLALPEAKEKETWGDPTFRVRDKIFAQEKRGDGRVSAWCKAPDGSQAVLVGADPARFFVPPYLGPKGWIGIRLDTDPDWEEVDSLIRRSYRLIAPKHLACLVESTASGFPP